MKVTKEIRARYEARVSQVAQSLLAGARANHAIAGVDARDDDDYREYLVSNASAVIYPHIFILEEFVVLKDEAGIPNGYDIDYQIKYVADVWESNPLEKVR